jgi:uncharacterized protein RhaS with RHS repeats
MYDPSLGRFLTEDPLGLSAGDINIYRYCFNNPINFTDPSGKTTFGGSTLLGAVGGAIVGFIAGAVSGEGSSWYNPVTWSFDRGLAGAGSGAMVGASIGLMVDTWGASTPLSTALVGAAFGAGIGSAVGGGLVTGRDRVNWSAWAKGGTIGAVSGFAGGYTSAVLAPVFGGGAVGGALTGFFGGVVGDLVLRA